MLIYIFGRDTLFPNTWCNKKIILSKFVYSSYSWLQLNKHLIIAYFREDPGGGNLVTFTQFVFIAIDGFLFTHKFGTVKPTISIKKYMVLVSMFFISSVFNNYAFNFNIPMPLHMIFRAVSKKLKIF